MPVRSVELDNPAGRLHAVLARLKQSQPSLPVRLALANALGLQRQTDLSHLTRRISILLDFPQQILSELAELDEVVSKDLLTQWVPGVTKALNNITFNANDLASITDHYSDGDLASLAVCSDLLHRHRPDPSLPGGELKELAKRITELQALVEIDQEIDTDLQKLLLRHLKTMKKAMDEAAFWGVMPVRAALAQAIGDLSLSPQTIARKETSPRTWEKVAAFLSLMTAIFSFGTTTLQAIDTPTPPPTVEVVVIQPPVLPSGGAPSTPEVQVKGHEEPSSARSAEKLLARIGSLKSHGQDCAAQLSPSRRGSIVATLAADCLDRYVYQAAGVRLLWPAETTEN